MPIISTIEAKCKDCYKCVRACPVKAIRIRGAAAGGAGTDGEAAGSGRAGGASVGGSVAPGGGAAAAGRAMHAEVVKERCILDGECLRICPQKAKKVRADAGRVRAWIEAGETVVASVAPSFAAVLPYDDPLRLVAAIRQLGFAAVGETIVGAQLVAAAVREEAAGSGAPSRAGSSSAGGSSAASSRSGGTPIATSARPPIVTTACPVVVNLMETVYPKSLRFASRVVSPMVAHGRILKAAYPEAKVVFIGPCVAKKDEAERVEVAGAVDAAITFVELLDWFIEEGVRPERLEPREFDGPAAASAELFPLEGGLLRAAALPTDLVSSELLAVSGMDNCRELLSKLEDELPPPELEKVRIVELLACRGGCVAGPATAPGSEDGTTPLLRRQRLLRFAEKRSKRPETPSAAEARLPRKSLFRTYTSRPSDLPVPSEAEIKEILARVGKHGPEDELNCGVCGYGSCREKAVAVYQGMAESDMCLPFMREMAESMSNLVVASAPYGVVTVNQDLRITYFNRTFGRMFGREPDEELVGRRIGEIVDDASFRECFARHEAIEAEVSYPEKRLLTRQTVFFLARRASVVGIFVDMTADLKQREQLEQMRGETIERAREVIAKQMKVAQEIAGLLGETTADTKVILTKLIEFINKEDAAGGRR